MNKIKGEIPITTNRTLEEIEKAIKIEKEKLPENGLQGLTLAMVRGTVIYSIY